MGSNRAGAAAKQRKKRREKFERRLALKAEAAQQPAGVVKTVKKAATTAAKSVKKAAKAVAKTVKDAVT